MNSNDQGFLFASIVWGAVGMGCLLYGKRQQSGDLMISGAVIIGFSYFINSWIWMSLACVITLLFKPLRRWIGRD